MELNKLNNFFLKMFYFCGFFFYILVQRHRKEATCISVVRSHAPSTLFSIYLRSTLISPRVKSQSPRRILFGALFLLAQFSKNPVFSELKGHRETETAKGFQRTKRGQLILHSQPSDLNLTAEISRILTFI